MEKIKKFFFKNTNNKQTVIKNTFWLFAGEASGRILKIVLIIYATRKLGVNGWGVFSYAISVASLLMIFSDIGISSLITREAIQEKENYKKFISATLLLKSVILLISTTLVIFLSQYMSNVKEAKALFPVIGIFLFFDSIRDIGFAINRILEKMELETFIKIFLNVIILIFGIILIKVNPLPVSMATAYAIGSASGTLLLLIIIRKKIKEFFVRTNIETLKLVLKTITPFAIIAVTANIMANADIYMLGIWKSPEVIGIYSAAQRFYQFILIIPSMIATATFPLMSRLANKDDQKFQVVFEKTLSIFMIIALPIALGGFALADQIIPLTFGAEYIKAIPVMQIFMITLIFTFPMLLLSNTIFVYNKQKKLIWANIFGVLADVFFNFLLIKKFGANGDAMATLISIAIITMLLWINMKKINDFQISIWLKKIILSTLIMVCSILILKHFGINVILNMLISTAVYFGFLILMKRTILRELKEIINT